MRTLLVRIFAVCVLTGFLGALAAAPPALTVVAVAKAKAIKVLEDARRVAESRGDTDGAYVLAVLVGRLHDPVMVKGVGKESTHKFVGVAQVDTEIVVHPGQSVSVRFRPELPPSGEVACHVRRADSTGTKWLGDHAETWKAEAEPHVVKQGGRLFLVPGGLGTSGQVAYAAMKGAGSFEAMVVVFEKAKDGT